MKHPMINNWQFQTKDRMALNVGFKKLEHALAEQGTTSYLSSKLGVKSVVEGNWDLISKLRIYSLSTLTFTLDVKL